MGLAILSKLCYSVYVKGEMVMTTMEKLFMIAGSRLYRTKRELAAELKKAGCYPVGGLWYLDLPEEESPLRFRRFVIHTKKVIYSDGLWYCLWVELADSPRSKNGCLFSKA